MSASLARVPPSTCWRWELCESLGSSSIVAAALEEHEHARQCTEKDGHVHKKGRANLQD